MAWGGEEVATALPTDAHWHWRAVVLQVATLSRNLSVPFFCKIRLLDELDDTLQFVQQARHCRRTRSPRPAHARDSPRAVDAVRVALGAGAVRVRSL
jgi:hypothetical protein